MLLVAAAAAVAALVLGPGPIDAKGLRMRGGGGVREILKLK